jgi:hypothetical protein
MHTGRRTTGQGSTGIRSEKWGAMAAAVPVPSTCVAISDKRTIAARGQAQRSSPPGFSLSGIVVGGWLAHTAIMPASLGKRAEGVGRKRDKPCYVCSKPTGSWAIRSKFSPPPLGRKKTPRCAPERGSTEFCIATLASKNFPDGVLPIVLFVPIARTRILLGD